MATSGIIIELPKEHRVRLDAYLTTGELLVLLNYIGDIKKQDRESSRIKLKITGLKKHKP